MDITETTKNGAKSNIVVSVYSKSENAGKLVHEGNFSAPMRDSKPLTGADEEAYRNEGTKAENRASSDHRRQGATSQPYVNVANKGTSERITAECIQNWSETIVVDDGWQDFRSETLLVVTKQVLEEEIYLVMSEHSLVQTEENLDYTMTETRN